MDVLPSVLLTICGGLFMFIVGREYTARSMRREFVTKCDCENNHKLVSADVQALVRGISDLKETMAQATVASKEDQRMIFRMIRALVSLSDLTPEEKAKILNDRA